MGRKVVLAGACRTAIGTMGGTLSNTPAPELGTVVIKEALHRCYCNKRETIKEEHLIVAPAVDLREVGKQYPEADEACYIGEYHADGGNDKVRAVAHFAL